MDASGRALDCKYLWPRPTLESWSNLVFPLEQPTPGNFRIWREALPRIRAPGGRLHLGKYICLGHKTWEWRYNLEGSKLYHCHGALVDIYEPSPFPGASTRANRYLRTRVDQATVPQGGFCMMEEAGLGLYKIMSCTKIPPLIPRPETFMDILRKWGYTWLWRGMRLTGDDTWVEEAIRLVAVTDGSYMRTNSQA